ncbi:MAG: galactokinase family protein [Bryobacteraceae bacterium]
MIGNTPPDPRALLIETFGPGGEAGFVSAPGRVNLIGEHIDYHGLAVLPMALRRSIRVAFRARADHGIRAVSPGYGIREFAWTDTLAPKAAGDWENYLRAAARAVGQKWGTGHGVDAAIVSDLPPAAGLSSSSALIVAFSLSLLGANGLQPGFEELMEVLPEGEQFVGTRGGGMDHAASLASREGCASLIEFDPVAVRAVPVPDDWAFLVAHSLTAAEKSGAVRQQYNARRAAGTAALARLGFGSYRAALAGRHPLDLEAIASSLDSPDERASFLHVVSEALRVRAAVRAMERRDRLAFGALLLASHASLRDGLRVSCPALDRLVDTAMESGAWGARLTGAGFGGCAVVFCARQDLAAVRRGLIARYYAGLAEFNESMHLIHAEPGPGALQSIKEPHASPHT